MRRGADEIGTSTIAESDGTMTDSSQLSRLPPDLQDLVQKYIPVSNVTDWAAISNDCAQFLELTRPFRLQDVAAFPEAFVAFRESLIYSLRRFLFQIRRLRVYRYASLGPYLSEEHRPPNWFLVMPVNYLDLGKLGYSMMFLTPPDPEGAVEKMLARWQERENVPNDPNDRICEFMKMMQDCQQIKFIKEELARMPAAFHERFNDMRQISATEDRLVRIQLATQLRPIMESVHMRYIPSRQADLSNDFHKLTEIWKQYKKMFRLLWPMHIFVDDERYLLFQEALSHDNAILADVLA